MNFEAALVHGIPRAEAAEFFIRLRGQNKTAQMTGASATTPAVLPPTAKGQNMQPQPVSALPPTAMGQHPKMAMAELGKTPEETGKERARASLTAEFDKEKAHKSERHQGLAGNLLGTLAGGVGAHYYGKGNPLATLGGAALGGHLGGKIGRETGASADRRRHEKAAAAFKLALNDTGLVGIEPALDPATQQYLAMEQEAQQGAEMNQSEFLRQKLDEARAEAQAATEQATELQSVQDQHDAQMQQIQAQVADSTQKSMLAQDQVLQQQQAAAAMRMAYQQLRGQLLEVASAEPPAILGPAGGADAASAAASQAAGPSNAPAPQSGPAGQAPNPGVPPVGMAPTGDDTVSTPATTNEPMFSGASPTTKVEQQEPTGDPKSMNSPKEVLSHFLPFFKDASLREFLGAQVGKAVPMLPQVLAGAALGAGAGALESRGNNEPLRAKIQALEAKPDRGVKDTANLAQARARLTIGEFGEKHPGAMMGAGALSGALAGAQLPNMVQHMKGSVGDLQAIGKNVKDIFKGAG